MARKHVHITHLPLWARSHSHGHLVFLIDIDVLVLEQHLQRHDPSAVTGSIHQRSVALL